MFVWQIYHTGIFCLVAFSLLQVRLISKINEVIKEEKDKVVKIV